MKFQRFLGGLLLCLGVICVLLALMAMLLLMIDNDQTRLILASLEIPSRSVVANGLNQAMLLLLRHHYSMLGAGAVLILLGVALLYYARSSRAQAYYEGPPAGARSAYAVVDGKESILPSSNARWRKPAYQPILPSKPSDFSNRNPSASPAVPSPEPSLDVAGPERQTPNPYRAYGQKRASSHSTEAPLSPSRDPSPFQPPEKPFSWLDSLSDAPSRDAPPPERPPLSALMESPSAAAESQGFAEPSYQSARHAPAKEPLPEPLDESREELPGTGLKPLAASMPPLAQEAPEDTLVFKAPSQPSPDVPAALPLEEAPGFNRAAPKVPLGLAPLGDSPAAAPRPASPTIVVTGRRTQKAPPQVQPPVSGDAGTGPQYLSPRIRSTMKRNSP
ncbi:MAG: hypothetical protein VB099_01030 [Candidatus Limiplasma sp.]|nr:hypothetical protein [Candidatus Limiplasma sp.]